jgi:RNase H-fold protein (predicted Holliday junction resolvase)
MVSGLNPSLPIPNPKQLLNYLGFDPGRDKCGVAVRHENGQVLYHEVVPSGNAIATLQALCQQYEISVVVMGNQTTAKTWRKQLGEALPDTVDIFMVDERYSTLESRDRYWQMYPPRGLARLLPEGLRSPPRPIDDIVAILLIERYLNIK